jgi:plastocyanin
VVVFCASHAPAADLTGKVTKPDGSPLPGAVVFVEDLPDGVSLPEKPTATMDQVGKEFVPRVLPVVVGTEVSFPNHDQIHHHVYSFSRVKTFETPLYKGEAAPPVVFDKVGAAKLGCNIHDWMAGVVLVLPTPYFAITGADGAYAIRDLPPGRHDVAVWHEQAQAKDEAARVVEVGEGGAEVSFVLEASPTSKRSAVHGARRYE